MRLACFATALLNMGKKGALLALYFTPVFTMLSNATTWLWTMPGVSRLDFASA